MFFPLSLPWTHQPNTLLPSSFDDLREQKPRDDGVISDGQLTSQLASKARSLINASLRGPGVEPQARHPATTARGGPARGARHEGARRSLAIAVRSGDASGPSGQPPCPSCCPAGRPGGCSVVRALPPVSAPQGVHFDPTFLGSSPVLLPSPIAVSVIPFLLLAHSPGALYFPKSCLFER